MPHHINRRNWLKQSSLAAFGAGISLASIAGEDRLPRNFGADTGLINLGANENPYGISPKAKEAIKDAVSNYNRYQFNVASLQSFRKELADYFGVAEENLLAMAGSSQALDLLPRYFNKGNLVAAAPTFFILPNTAKRIGMQVIEVPLTNDKVHDLPAMLSAISNQTQLVYVVNPANPTATIVNPDALKSFCMEASKKTTVLVDEAYIDFVDPPSNQSMMSLVASNPNIIVMRTFSKIHGIAGLRVGCIMAHASLIMKLEDDFFSDTQVCISNPAIVAAMASMKDEEHRKITREKNAAAKQYTYNALTQMNLRCMPSYTNFMFFKLNNYAGDFSKDMLEKNILLRSNTYSDGKWARVSIGTMDEMKQFISVMREMKF